MLYEQKNPHGGDGYGMQIAADFSVNTNPLGPPEAVCRAVQESIGQLACYPDPFCRELTGAIAQWEGAAQENLLCGNGAAELIHSYCQALRPRRAMELAPTFCEYTASLEAVGCTVVRYPLSPDRGFALEEDVLSFLEQQAPDVLFLCHPNNPTGRLVDPVLRERIVEQCRRQGTRLFVDECFLDLSDQGREASFQSYLLDWPGLFLLKAFTKSYAMAGLRLGYGISADRALLAQMSRMVQAWNVSLPAQKAGEAALGENAYLAEARKLIVQERAYLERALREYLGARICPSQANYMLFYCDRPLYEALLEQGILIRRCANYPGLGQGWYRIAVKRPEENRLLVAALCRIAEEE